MRVGRVAVGFLAFLCALWAFAQLSREEVQSRGSGRVPAGREVSFRPASGDAEAAITPASGSIGTVASASPARPQGVFGRREDVFLAGGPLTSPCFFPAYLPDGKYYFQVTDSTGKTLLSTDVVSERAVTVKGGVIGSYDGKTHTVDGKTACGSLAVNLMPYADAGSQKAAYVVWLTSAANFDGSAAAVDNICGAGCFHGFHADLSRTFGFRVEDKKSCEPTFCVSGVKFLDSNGNGARDSGEPGLAGVDIRVADENGVLLNGLSGPDGSFEICGLTDNGAFKVSETVPSGYAATAPADRDISRHVFARSGAFILELCKEDISGLDFGNKLLPNAIGGLKFEDLNANGARDPGEPALAGVTIRLNLAAAGNPFERTAVTDASGNFLFTDVQPGSYVLTEVVPAGFTQTMPASGGIPVTLTAGGTSLNNVFGNFHGILTGTISGLKFEDRNGNGVRDASEPGMSGVTITLSGAPQRTVVTGADGSFSFTAVPFGTYTLSETVPAGFQQTAPPSPGTLLAVLDFGHQAVSGLAFGNRALPASIAGTKFNDVNGNGVKDSGETGLSGVTIQLRNADQTLAATTDASGNFSFTGLAAGTYTLSELVPVGFVQTAPGGAGTISVTVTPGQNATGFLFGNRAAVGSIAGTKFNDANGNGTRDTGEAGVSGVTIQLRNSIGQVLSTTTDTSGNFSFTALPAGAYLLSEVVPAGSVQTLPGGGAGINITLTPGQNATGFLFGNQVAAPASISGVKFNDANGNGLRDTGEAGVSGVTIQLRNSAGQLQTATTDASGNFSFTNLPAGAYVLSEVVPAGSVQTLPGGGAGINITLTPGQNATGFLFGNQVAVAASASISGLKFNDANANGVRDTGELGLAGVSIKLRETPFGQTFLATTDSTGAFSFTGLAAGGYVLFEVVPAGFTQTAPPAPGWFIVTLAAGENATGFLFGNADPPAIMRALGTRLGLISGTKYLDLNTNGILDGIDRPQEEIVFVLTDANGVTRQTTSAADGTFSFSNLPPGNYVLSEILPANFFQTFPVTPTNPGTYKITLAPGQQATGFLFLNKY
jgi:SdrD B-like domain/Prealbumin-like fold domain